MAATVVAVQALFKQGNTLFGEIEGIKYACMALFAFSYSTIKEKNRQDQSDLDSVLVNGDVLYKTFRKQTLLTEEDLPRNFKLDEEQIHAHLKENRYDILDWDLSGVNADVLDNLVLNPERQGTGSIFFIQVKGFITETYFN